MKWQEIRTHFPQQWLLVEAIQARTEANKCPLEHMVVIGTFPTAAAKASRQRLQRLAPGCELYVFHTSQETLDVASEPTESQSVGKRDIDKPANITITSNRNQVRISWKHLGFGAQFVALSWFMFFVVVIFGEGDKQELFNTTCLAPLVILVLATFYYLLVWLNNEMVVQVDQATLKTSWEGPIPCFYTDRMIPSIDIRQVYIKHWVSGGKSRTSYYDIYILTANGSHEKFATIENGDLALYLEQEIERFLGIKDQVMRGEWRPDPYLWES